MFLKCANGPKKSEQTDKLSNKQTNWEQNTIPLLRMHMHRVITQQLCCLWQHMLAHLVSIGQAHSKFVHAARKGHLNLPFCTQFCRSTVPGASPQRSTTTHLIAVSLGLLQNFSLPCLLMHFSTQMCKASFVSRSSPLALSSTDVSSKLMEWEWASYSISSNRCLPWIHPGLI